MTPDEARLANERIRAWPPEDRASFLRLTDREKLLVGEAVALLDIRPCSEPVDPLTIDLRGSLT